MAEPAPNLNAETSAPRISASAPNTTSSAHMRRTRRGLHASSMTPLPVEGQQIPNPSEEVADILERQARPTADHGRDLIDQQDTDGGRHRRASAEIEHRHKRPNDEAQPTDHD